jgi:membrane protein implicated in regulation of membrane protease activity
MPWWAWLVLGFALLAGELLNPGGLYLLFVGIGALIVGILTLARLSGPEWVQWLLFAAISVASVLALRGRLARSFPPRKLDRALVGDTIELTTAIAPGGFGQGRLRGSVWQVHNAGSDDLDVGARCRIDDVDGITLRVGEPAAAPEGS